MSRRAALPGAAELFRRTTVRPAPVEGLVVPAGRRGSARERHDSKITVYVTDSELVALERARLELRAEHGIVVDRGRIVREAVALILADLEARGGDAVLVRRLADR